MNTPTIPNNLNPVMADILLRGGKPLLVGGAIRDHLLGLKPKDLDIEVYNMAPEALVALLSKHGKVDQVGVSFGVIKLYMGGRDFDFSLPRRENKAGVGHKGFIIKPDPTMTVEEACGRRDFTINAMAFDFATGHLLDFFGGQADLEARVLRHTTEAFSEDPLRVLRGFQFAGRLNMTVDPKTAELCRSLKSEFPTLAKERIWGEWEKWALKSVVPSKGLIFLEATGWDQLFPEIVCSSFRQGVVDRAANFADNLGMKGDARVLTILGSLGILFQKCESFLVNTLGAPNWFVERITKMNKMTSNLGNLEPTEPKVRRLAVGLEPATILQLLPVAEAVIIGPKQAEKLMAVAIATGSLEGKPKPILMGKHLIELGIKPGPEMGKILKEAYENQLDGRIVDLPEALDFAKGSA